jgi:hypothetical protein
MNSRAELESTVCIDDQHDLSRIIDPAAEGLLQYSPFMLEAYTEDGRKRRLWGADGMKRASWLAWKINGSGMPKQYKARALTVTTI